MPNVPVEIPLATTFDENASSAVSIESLTNMYIDKGPPSHPIVIKQFPGFDSIGTIDDGSQRIRGIAPIAITGVPWAAVAVTDVDVFTVYQDGSELLVEASAFTSSAVYNYHLVSLGDYVVIVNPDQGTAVYTNGLSGFQAPPVVGLPSGGVLGACAQDGYVVYPGKNTDAWWISELDNPGQVSALQYTTADAFPGFCTGCASFNREVWIFKEWNTEIYQNTGASPFPFERAQVIDVGCLDHGTIASSGDRLFWVDRNFHVRMTSGYQPTVISTPAIEHLIRSSSLPTAGPHGMIWYVGGHTFYVLRLYSVTIAYDVNTGSWSRLTGNVGGSEVNWPFSCIVTLPTYDANGENVILAGGGDSSTGASVDGDVVVAGANPGLHGSDPVRREIITPPITAGGDRRAIMSEFYLECEVGGASGTAANAEILLSWSDDDGQTWANDRTAYLDGANTYKTRARWTRLGSFRRRSMRIRVSDNINFVALKAWARIDTGD